MSLPGLSLTARRGAEKANPAGVMAKPRSPSPARAWTRPARRSASGTWSANSSTVTGRIPSLQENNGIQGWTVRRGGHER